MSPDGRPVTEVAVGVLLRPGGQVLLADRPQGKAYAGYWEFPGGKVEPGETVEGALARELREELGVRIGASMPWVVFEYSYPHAYVRLHFRRVERWSGEPRAREGQRLRFVDPRGELPEPLLPAAVPTLRWLRLPALVAPSRVGDCGMDAFLASLDRAIAAGLPAVLVDEPELTPGQLATAEREIALRLDATGAAMLRMRPFGTSIGLSDRFWTGVRVRDARELHEVAASGADFAVVGPVMPSESCTDPAIGWTGFAAIMRSTPLPVYAFGSLGSGDIEVARRHGAHGILLDPEFWCRDVVGR